MLLFLGEFVRSNDELKNNDFTVTGIKRYEDTLNEYENELFNKSIYFAEIDKAADLDKEVTHTHIRNAAIAISNSYGKNKLTTWDKIGQVGELIFTGIGSFGLAKTDEKWGIAIFVISGILVAVLLMIRISRSSER